MLTGCLYDQTLWSRFSRRLGDVVIVFQCCCYCCKCPLETAATECRLLVARRGAQANVPINQPAIRALFAVPLIAAYDKVNSLTLERAEL